LSVADCTIDEALGGLFGFTWAEGTPPKELSAHLILIES
jgi:hypothetical protein|tara:strand:+ start:734 stop:850 length:117 start_codon:yes stop_codon:yes gene_type:complete